MTPMGNHQGVDWILTMAMSAEFIKAFLLHMHAAVAAQLCCSACKNQLRVGETIWLKS